MLWQRPAVPFLSDFSSRPSTMSGHASPNVSLSQITHATHGSPAQAIQVRRSEWLVNSLDNTGRFEHTRQASSGVHTLMLYGYDHATIYVLPSGRWAHIRVDALENGRFPNTTGCTSTFASTSVRPTGSGRQCLRAAPPTARARA